MTALGADFSNFSSPLTSDALAKLKADGYALAIVQAVTPNSDPAQSVTVTQMQALTAAGFQVQAYVYQYLDSPLWMPAQTTLLDQAVAQGCGPSFVWLDVEDTSMPGWTPAERLAAVQRDLATLDSWCSAHGLPPAGLYTGRWYWAGYLGNATDCADRPLWVSQYDGDANPANVTLFGGWQAAAIKQWAGTSSLHGLSGIDLNAADDAFLASLTGGSSDVVIPQDLVDKFHLANNQDIGGLVANYDAIIGQLVSELNSQNDCPAKLDAIRTVLAQLDATAAA